jgi:hypothetical protein
VNVLRELSSVWQRLDSGNPTVICDTSSYGAPSVDMLEKAEKAILRCSPIQSMDMQEGDSGVCRQSQIWWKL